MISTQSLVFVMTAKMIIQNDSDFCISLLQNRYYKKWSHCEDGFCDHSHNYSFCGMTRTGIGGHFNK